MKKVKHIVVTRLAIKWRFKETKLSWEDWVNNSLELMDSICRPSLKNQSNKNFTLLSIVDESVKEYGNVLDNEIVLKVPTLKDNEFPKEFVVDVINNYIKEFNEYDSIILSRLDRDDAIRFDFIDNVQKHLSNKVDTYIDINNSLSYNYLTKDIYKSKKYFNTFVSPFVSVHEKINNKKIKCISLIFDHSTLSKHLKGKKVNNLYAMQVIHEYNLLNKVQGDKININLKDYGIL